MINDYESEARSRWGNTEAYREYKKKTKSYIEEKYDAVNVGMKAIYDEFYVCRSGGKSADSAEAQALVSKFQTHITENYYTCTDEILAGLGQMYVSDCRFIQNIDKSGEGTAQFVSDAIAAYITRK